MLATQNSWHSVAPVAELLHLKANSNAKATGISILAEACTAETVRLLVEHRAEINAVQDPWRLPPLAIMAARPAVEMGALQEMLSLRADVNAGSYAPFISLAAHYNGHANGPKVAQLLLDARADVNKAGSCESMLFSVLGMFSRTCSRCIPTQPILMKYFANLKGCTPLTCAVLMGDRELAKLLLLQRADPDIKNYNGKKPFEVALNDEMRRKFTALRATEEEDETGLHVLRACKSQLVEVALWGEVSLCRISILYGQMWSGPVGSKDVASLKLDSHHLSLLARIFRKKNVDIHRIHTFAAKWGLFFWWSSIFGRGYLTSQKPPHQCRNASDMARIASCHLGRFSSKGPRAARRIMGCGNLLEAFLPRGEILKVGFWNHKCVPIVWFILFFGWTKTKTEETTNLSGPNPLSVEKCMRHGFGGIWFVSFLWSDWVTIFSKREMLNQNGNCDCSGATGAVGAAQFWLSHGPTNVVFPTFKSVRTFSGDQGLDGLRNF